MLWSHGNGKGCMNRRTVTKMSPLLNRHNTLKAYMCITRWRHGKWWGMHLQRWHLIEQVWIGLLWRKCDGCSGSAVINYSNVILNNTGLEAKKKNVLRLAFSVKETTSVEQQHKLVFTTCRILKSRKKLTKNAPKVLWKFYTLGNKFKCLTRL